MRVENSNLYKWKVCALCAVKPECTKSWFMVYKHPVHGHACGCTRLHKHTRTHTHTAVVNVKLISWYKLRKCACYYDGNMKHSQCKMNAEHSVHWISLQCTTRRKLPLIIWVTGIIPYPTAFPYGNGMVLHFYQQQESSTTKTVHKVINKRLKTYV